MGYFLIPRNGVFYLIVVCTIGLGSSCLANPSEIQSTATLAVKSSLKVLGGSADSSSDARTAIRANYYFLKNTPGTLFLVATGYRPEAEWLDDSAEYISSEEKVSRGKLILPVVRKEKVTGEKWRLSKIRITYP